MRLLFQVALIIIFFFISCKKQENDDKPDQPEEIHGVIQKGPFVSESNVYLFALDEGLEPTGTSYSAKTIDNRGSYRISGIWEEPFVEFQSGGFFFNEITGTESESSLYLRALSKSTDTVNNLNIGTTVIADRITYLVQSEGIDFDNAKRQSQNEILRIFKIEENNSIDFNKLDLLKNEEQHGILLAMSVAFMGSLEMNQVNDLLIEFIEDFKQDGQINTGTLNKLALNEKNLNLKSIRNNILGFEEINAAPFEKYAKRLIDLEVIGCFPADSSRSVPSNIDSISVSFNKPVNPQSVTSSNIIVTNSSGIVDGTLEYNDESYTILFKPSAELLKGEEYHVTVTVNLSGTDNIKLGMAHEFNFKTIGVDLNWGLKAFFPFNNSSADASGNGHTANLINTNFTTDISGNTNRACQINGAGSYIEMPNIINITQLNWSYSIWLKLNTLESGTIPMLLGTKESGGAFSESPLYIRSSNGHVTSYNIYQLETNESIGTGTWYHVVAVIQNSVMTIYINGHQAANGVGYLPHWDDEGGYDPDFDGEDIGLFNFYSGNYYVSEKRRADLPTYINGIVDNIRFYDRPLTAEEVLELYSKKK